MFHVARQDVEKVQERSADHHSSTYIESGVGVEGRIMDDKSSIKNVDGSTILEVACPPPGIGARKIQESSQRSFGITYIGGRVALEGAIIDLNIGTTSPSINSSALEVACPPPGHRENSGKFCSSSLINLQSSRRCWCRSLNHGRQEFHP
jgi:hypothetical protein